MATRPLDGNANAIDGIMGRLGCSIMQHLVGPGLSWRGWSWMETENERRAQGLFPLHPLQRTECLGCDLSGRWQIHSRAPAQHGCVLQGQRSYLGHATQ